MSLCRQRSRTLLAALLLLFAAGSARAQSIVPQGVVTAVATTSQVTTPSATVADAFGNLYIADYGANLVRKVAAGTGVITTVAGTGVQCSAPTATCGDGSPAISAQMFTPTSVALDSFNNLYIDDGGDERIRVVCNVASGFFCSGKTVGDIYTVAGNGNTCTGVCGDGAAATSARFASFTSIAIDSVGNLYIADAENFRIRIVCAVTTGNYCASQIAGDIYTVAGTTTQCSATGTCGDGGPATAVAAQLDTPQFVTVDSSQNIYIADLNRIREVTASTLDISTLTGSGTQCPVHTGACGDGGTAVNATLTNEQQLAVDSFGNLLIADGGDLRVRVVCSTTSGVFCAGRTVGDIYTVAGNPAAVACSGGLNGPALSLSLLCGLGGVALDASSNLYIVDESTDAPVVKVNYSSVNLGSVNIGSTSSTFTIPFSITAAADIEHINVLTQGATGLDFQVVASGSCAIGNQTIGTSCTVEVNFSPKHPGSRYGAVELTTGAGVVLANVYLIGTGTGPQVTYSPNTQSTLSSSFTAPWGAAVDASGNLFVADEGGSGSTAGNSAIYEVLAAGGYTTVNTLVNTGINRPTDVVVDGSGNAFFTDFGNQVVKEITSASGYATVTTLPTPGGSFNSLYDLAVDGSGNIFIGDGGNGRVSEVTAASGYTTVIALPVPVASFSNIRGVAVDGNGNVFVADGSHNAVKEITVASGYTTVNTLVSGLSFPWGIALDGSGNIYVADTGNKAVKQITAASGYTTVNTLATGLNSLLGLAVDGSGNVYPAQSNSPTNTIKDVLKLDTADPPALSFGSLSIGSNSAAQSVAIENFGNATLASQTSTAISIPNGFAQVAGSGTPTDCNAITFALNMGAECNISIEFQPSIVGGYTGNALINDNALNNLSAQQRIALTGIGSVAATTLTLSASPVSPSTYQSVTLTATLSPSSVLTNSTDSEPISFTINTIFAGTSTLTGGVATLNTTSLHAGTNTVIATYNTDGNFASATSLPLTYVVTQASQTINFAPLADKFTTDPQFTVSASGGGSNNPVDFFVTNTAFGWTTASAGLSAAINSPVAGTPGDGMIYVVGGAGPSGATATLQQYNPATGVWTAKTNKPMQVYQADAASIGGQLYVAGGWNAPLTSVPTNVLEAYNPTTNTWATLHAMSHLSACGAAGAINNKLYVLTGCNGSAGYFGLLDVYDPSTNAWSGLTSAPSSHGSGAGGVISGKFYVVGGFNAAGNATNPELDVYDPTVPGWTTKSPMPVGLQGISADVINGKLYVVGGEDSSSNFNATVYVYDPVADHWSTPATAMTTAVGNPGAVAMGGALYVAAGNNAGGNTSALQILNTNQCTLFSGNLVTLTGSPGICTVTANQLGNTDYLDAAPVSQSFNITIAPITKLVFGTSPATPITAGGNAGTVTVLEQSAGSVTQPTGADNITLTVTGPNSYSQVYHSTAVSGIATFNLSAVALAASGTYTYTATFAALTPAVATETVNPGITTHFSVVTAATATAGVTLSPSVTVTALDGFNNTTPAYAGTVHFTSTDAIAVLPANYTFVAGDAGVHVFTATLRTSGSQTITATDIVTPPTITGFATITISAAAATHFTVSAPSTATAGTAINVTVTALDVFNNIATGYTGIAHFTSTDAIATLPANYTFVAGDNGVHIFSVTLKTAGTQTVTATDTVTPSITGITASITVSPAAATHYTVTAPNTATAGVSINATVTAFDQFNNIATGYRGIAHFTSTDAVAVLPADYTFVAGDNGVHIFPVTLKTSGSQTITALDTVAPSITGTSGNITVSPAAATHFSVSTPGSAIAGVSFNVNVTAVDAFNNTATGYAGTVHFTSSDAIAVLPANTLLISGLGTFTMTLKTAGTQTITATDTLTPSITGFATDTVTAAAASHYTVSAPGTATAGTAISVTVTAFDPFNNIATGYTGIAHFTSSDSIAVLPANYAFLAGDAGVHVFSATLKTAGSKTITATDTVTPSITGVTGNIIVSAGANAQFAFANASPVIAGTPFNVIVTAEDAFGNVNTAYAGTIHFTSSDAAAVLPANYTYVAGDVGVHTFSVTMNTANGALPLVQTLTVKDTVSSVTSLTSITINPPVPIAGAVSATVLANTISNPITLALSGGAAASVTVATNASHGTATASGTTITYTPTNGYTGPDSFTYTATNVTATSAPATVTIQVNKIPVTVTLGGLSPTYTGLPHSAIATTAITSSGTPVTVSSITFTYNGSSTPPTAVLAGGYAVIATVVDPIYIGTATGTLNIGTAALTITGPTLSKVYGAVLPSLNGTFFGQQNGDTFIVTGTTTATVLSPVVAGGYPIVPSATGANIADYTVTPVNGTLTITQANTSAALTVGTQNALAGQNNTYTATITSLTSGTPTGTVQFLENGVVFGSASLVSGQATLTSAALGAGTYSITIAYSGDNNFLPNSAAGAVVVDVNLPDFTLIATTPPVVDMQFGSTAAFTMHLTPQTGSFYRNVDFTITGVLPLDAVVTLLPNPILAGAGATDVTFTVATTKLAWYRTPAAAGGGALLCVLMLPFLRPRRLPKTGVARRLTMLGIALIVCLGATCGISGCGAGYTAASYPIVITANSGGVVHTITVTVVIEHTSQ